MITKIDGDNVKSMEDVIKVVDSKKPGDEVTVTVLRDGKTKYDQGQARDPAAEHLLGDVDATRAGGQGDGGQSAPQIPGLP